ncbi:MAG: hypothetical protein R3183_01685 [Oleiphilaceae bacterium]|nr:hypothetical protein [Oleiphilaceae bacterium]
MRKIVTLLLFAISLSACVGHKQSSVITETELDSEPRIIRFLPEMLQGYRYEDYENYGGNLGYSLRYRKENEPYHMADFFIWPVSKEALKYPHKDIVFSVADGSLQDIYSAQDAGLYNKVEVLESNAYDTNGKILVVTKLSMLRDNLSSLSYLVVTEHRGKYIKARASFADNSANRERGDIAVFLVDFINQIIRNIENA